MRSRRARAAAVLAFAVALAAAPAGAASTGHGQRVGTAPPVPAGARQLGALRAGAPLSMTVALRPRDAAALAAYAAAVSTPGSPDYRRYLPVSAFVRRFAPAPATVAAVRASLRADGLRVGALSANGLSLAVSADAAAVGRAFSTSLQRYALRGGRVAYANAVAPSLDPAIAGYVQSVLGLDDLARPRPLGIVRGRLAPRAAPVTPCAAASSTAGSASAYTADQLAAAYGFGGLYAAGDQGAGQTVAILELEGNFPGDVATYQSCYGTAAPVSYATVAPGPTPPDASKGDGVETELDVETVIGLAPQARIAVYQGANTGSGPYDTYNRIISDDTARVISTSWGICEPILGSSNAQAESTLFQEAAVQGQSIVAAAGDNGAQDCFPRTIAAVDDPASQPFVTGVGGTSLQLSPARSETVWNNGASGSGAGGGGDSALWTMPPYQSTFATALSTVNAQSSTATCSAPAGAFCREVPDVSASADPKHGYVISYGGGWIVVGGSSAAAPLWAAVLTLADASGSCAGSPVGFANPALYRAAAAGYAGTFNDVTSGNNDWQGLNGGRFAAATGYDQATGLGTPIAAALVPAICSQTLRIATPAAQSSVLMRAGTSLQLQASDGPGQTVTFSATGLPPGLAIASATGAISGTPEAAGTFTPRILATDAGGAIAATDFQWTIVPATITLQRPASQRAQAGHVARLELSAGIDNGRPITFSATGLPAGLQLDHTSGVISGVPARAGVSSVTVTAAAAGANPASVSFTLTVAGAPSGTGASLTGVGGGRPRLRLTVLAGALAPGVRTIAIRFPAGLSVARSGRLLRRGVTVSAPVSSVTRAGATVRITLGSAAASVRVTITGPALAASRRVRHQRVRVGVTATDAAGTSTPLTLSLRAA